MSCVLFRPISGGVVFFKEKEALYKLVSASPGRVSLRGRGLVFVSVSASISSRPGERDSPPADRPAATAAAAAAADKLAPTDPAVVWGAAGKATTRSHTKRRDEGKNTYHETNEDFLEIKGRHKKMSDLAMKRRHNQWVF